MRSKNTYLINITLDIMIYFLVLTKHSLTNSGKIMCSYLLIIIIHFNYTILSTLQIHSKNFVFIKLS
jgi:hypothetical protein